MPKVVHIEAHLSGGVREALTNIARHSQRLHGFDTGQMLMEEA